MHIIETDIEIDADPASVWAVLVDRHRYAEWNPFIRRMDGDLTVGERLAVEIGTDGRRPMRFHPRVVAVEPERHLAWLGRFLVPGIFDGEHSFTIQPIDGGHRTRFVHAERFSGLLVRISRGMLNTTGESFGEFNEALKHRVEQVVGAPR